MHLAVFCIFKVSCIFKGFCNFKGFFAFSKFILFERNKKWVTSFIKEIFCITMHPWSTKMVEKYFFLVYAGYMLTIMVYYVSNHKTWYERIMQRKNQPLFKGCYIVLHMNEKRMLPRFFSRNLMKMLSNTIRNI